MKKLFSLILCAALVCVGSLSADALSDGSPFEILLNPGTSHYTTTVFSTLDDALAAGAQTGLNVELVRNATTANPQTISSDITLLTDYEGYTFLQSKKRSPMTLTYTGTTESLFTIANGGKLTLDNITLVGNTNTTVQKGGLIYVKNGGKLFLRCSDVTLKDSVLNASGSCGGAIYAENGAVINVLGVTYADNAAAICNNIYIEGGAVYRYVDLNQDGSADIRDLVRFKRYLADNTLAIYGTPDFNSDQAVNAEDVLAYRQFLFDFSM